MSTKKIYIDPGHSDKDPGAVGFAVERDLNEITAKYMHEHLQENYIVESKIDPITNNGVKQVADNANAWKADLLVSIHNNAGGGDGWEGLVLNSLRVPLGRIFEKRVEAIGQNSRGVKLRPDLGVLKHSNMPAILNEGAFVDNQKDIADWDEEHELKKLGIAYAEAAAEFLKLEKKEKTVTVTLPVLSYGRKNDPSVKVMQALLKGLGYKVNPTGNYGKSTKAAVIAAQEYLGLPVTGAMDEATWKAVLFMK